MKKMDDVDDVSYSFYIDRRGGYDEDMDSEEEVGQIINNCKTPTVNKKKGGKDIISQTPPECPLYAVTKRSKEKWTDDSAAQKCKSCHAVFRIYRRRHHCRSCSNIFCDDCSRFRCRIPQVVKKIPTRTGKEEPINYNEDVRLCKPCFNSYQAIHKLEKLFTVFSFLSLDLKDFKTIACVSKEWNMISAFYMSKFREIQYKLPKQSYNSWETQMLWTNRSLLQNHSIWQTHVLLSTEGERFVEVVDLYFGKKEKTDIKKISSQGMMAVSKDRTQARSCWNRMCSRYCKNEIDDERALLLLDVLRKRSEVSEFVPFSDDFTEQEKDLQFRVEKAVEIISEKIGDTFFQCDDGIFECYLPYILYNILLTDNDILKKYVFLKCTENLRIANCTYWDLKMNNKPVLTELLEVLPKDFYIAIIRGQNLVETLSNGGTVKGNIISVLSPELGEQEVFVDKISVKESATRPVLIPCDKSSILYKKDDIRKDYIIMCVIRLMHKILESNGIQSDYVTYNVQPTSEGEGFIEIVENCETLYNISEKMKISIINYLLRNNPNESVAKLRKRFVNSCASQSVSSYLISLNDRNTENLMLTHDGKFFNIDFGYCLGADPKPLKTSCIRITSQMLDALGGENSTEYIEFKELCGKIYDILRRHVNTFVCLLSLVPTFKNTSATSPVILEEHMMMEIILRFSPGESYDTAVHHLKTRIDDSANPSSFSKYHVIDFLHKLNREKTVTNYLHYGYNSSKYLLSSMYDYIYSFKG
jgi:hypothetical protein